MAQRSTKSQTRSRSRSSQNGRSSRNGRNAGSWKTSPKKADTSAMRPAQLAHIEENESNREYRRYTLREEEDRVGPPDVLLDVPELHVESIHFELDDLDAHVALKANVLNLVKLNVGVDVHLSRVKLDIKGVEAELVLKARLDHVAAIVDRLMTTLDRNPDLIKGLSKAVSEVGQGAGQAVDKTGDTVEEVGDGAQSAVGDIGQGAGEAVGDIGQGAGQAVGDVGQLVGGLGQTVGQAGQGVVGGLTGGGQQQGSSNGQPNGSGQAHGPGSLAKEVAKLVVREVGHAASDEARDLSLAAARKVRELGERRDQRRAEKHGATEAAVRMASELGIDLADIEGSGSEGRITVNDVRAAQPA